LSLPTHSESTRWVKGVPIKIDIFAWRARRDCLPTRINLIRREGANRLINILTLQLNWCGYLLCNSEDLISSLDLGNPLHLQNSNFSSNTIISVKLTGTENYRVWAAAMILTINTRNKTGFINGTCVKSAYVNSAPMPNQWERCNFVVLSWLLNSVSEDLFLVDFFLIMLLSLLTRETLSDVKDGFAIVSREDSQRGITSSSFGSVTKPQISGFVSKTNNWCFDLIGYPPGYNKNPGSKPNGCKTFNANPASTSIENGATLSFTNEQIIKLMNLINDLPSGNMQANMAGEIGGSTGTFRVQHTAQLNVTTGLTTNKSNNILGEYKKYGARALLRELICLFLDIAYPLSHVVEANFRLEQEHVDPASSLT
nr:putative Gag-polypeptide of LTR copia-type [Tanacetum cinerariifolium]